MVGRHFLRRRRLPSHRYRRQVLAPTPTLLCLCALTATTPHTPLFLWRPTVCNPPAGSSARPPIRLTDRQTNLPATTHLPTRHPLPATHATSPSARNFRAPVLEHLFNPSPCLATYADVEEVELTVGTSGVNIKAPSGSGSHWQVQVAVGAVKECVESASVSWKVCGQEVVVGQLPLFLDMPSPLNASMAIDEGRLASPSDDASISGANLPTSSLLTVKVSFDDGSQKTVSTDSRVTYSTPDAACATVTSANMVSITSGATCTSVVVVATIQLGFDTFVVNHTRPVVYMSHIALSFTGYPTDSGNSGRAVTVVGLLPCHTTSNPAYFHATASVQAYLSDSTTYDATPYSAFQSSDLALVSVGVSSTRMTALASVRSHPGPRGRPPPTRLPIPDLPTPAARHRWSAFRTPPFPLPGGCDDHSETGHQYLRHQHLGSQSESTRFS